MPRLFVGLELPPDIAFALSLKRGGLPGARFIDQEKYHITLRFIGDVDGRTADDVVDALARIERGAFDLSLGNLDIFASARKPHSLWASVSPSVPLAALQSEIERRMRQIGLTPDSRRFTPHVTIARLKGTRHEAAARYLSERGDHSSRAFAVNDFVLFSSLRSGGGGPYRVEERFALLGANSHVPPFQEPVFSFSRSA